MTAAERIAEALEEHDSAWVEWPTRGWQCRCGATVESGAGLAKHQAEVIVGLSGIAVVELPEPVLTDYDSPSWGCDDNGEEPTVVASPRTKRVRIWLQDSRLDNGYAAELAGYLLAADRAAGGAS